MTQCETMYNKDIWTMLSASFSLDMHKGCNIKSMINRKATVCVDVFISRTASHTSGKNGTF